MPARFYKVNSASPPPEVIALASRVIKSGGVVIFPTETVYGLGGDGSRREVVERIYQIKGRSRDKSLTRLIADRGEVEALWKKAEHRRLAERFWPGPLTLILELPDGTRQGVRFPDHFLSRRIIQASMVPLVATSANLSGQPEVTTGREARKEFGEKVDLILDGGRISGKASTVLDLTVSPERILRAGPVTREMIEECLDRVLE